MLCTEWTITVCQALLRLAQMKYQYFVPECCKENAIFSGTNHQNKTDHISIRSSHARPTPLPGPRREGTASSCQPGADALWQALYTEQKRLTGAGWMGPGGVMVGGPGGAWWGCTGVRWGQVAGQVAG